MQHNTNLKYELAREFTSLNVEYEEFVKDTKKGLEPIFEWLGLEFENCPITTKKNPSKPLHEQIENYDEIKDLEYIKPFL